MADLPEQFQPYADYLAGRSMIVKKAEPILVECIVRGYLTGSGKKTYDADGTVCGIKLPEGLVEASKLDEPIFTPSTKAAIGDHDENISYEQLVEPRGRRARRPSCATCRSSIYTAAADYARDAGHHHRRHQVRVRLHRRQGDPDRRVHHARLEPLLAGRQGYEPGKVQPSYDKQFVRDWLKANWDFNGRAAGAARRDHRREDLRQVPRGLRHSSPVTTFDACEGAR